MGNLQHTDTTRNTAERRRDLERELRDIRDVLDRRLGHVLQELMQLERLEAEQARQLEPELHRGCACRGGDGR